MKNENMSFLKALILLVPIIAFLGLYVGINSFLGLKEIWVGFLLLWYWGMEKHANKESLLKTILPGSVVGVVAAAILHSLPSLLGTVGLMFSLFLIVFIVICTFTGWLKTFVNGSTFLYLTVLSIPAVAAGPNYVEYLEVIVVASIYLGVSSWLMETIKKAKNTEDVETGRKENVYIP